MAESAERGAEASDGGTDFLKHLVDGETTHTYLTEILYSTKTNFQPVPGCTDKNEKSNYTLQAQVDCDEVYPNIYISDEATAKNKKYLKMLGITHIVNAAEGKQLGCVNTDANYYKDTDIKYFGLPLIDLPSTCISKYFQTTADFMEDALQSGGKIIVHCVMGMSRSATCVLAYLMMKKHMLAATAIRTVRSNRDIQPNSGFLQQLAQLDNRLRRQRL